SSLTLRGTRASLVEIGGFRPLRGAIAALKRTAAGSDRSKPAGKTGKGWIRTSACGRKSLFNSRRHTIRLPARLRQGRQWFELRLLPV
ncbi:hypothetical protein, partial [Mesorhizobium tamadayense]|uniref:hypothetical protein n=1 Tax=Mesorhizobium tamadayense TaxID=425306 RepID=UPI00197D4A43